MEIVRGDELWGVRRRSERCIDVSELTDHSVVVPIHVHVSTDVEFLSHVPSPVNHMTAAIAAIQRTSTASSFMTPGDSTAAASRASPSCQNERTATWSLRSSASQTWNAHEGNGKETHATAHARAATHVDRPPHVID